MDTINGFDKIPARTILLVEDEPSVRQITRHVLESAGYLVLEASDPVEAVKIFRRSEGCVHLLLTDVVMPSMSGAELAAHLKRLRPSLITVFMSGYARHPALSPSPVDYSGIYIQKPFTVSTLLSRVAEALSLPSPAIASERTQLPI